MLVATTGICWAQTTDQLMDVQKYDRAIHVMAMLLVGFGFLMVFVRKYRQSALTATFMLAISWG
jgi:ammonium transporter Rh